MAPNPYLLAADNSPALVPLLRESPSLASAQDEHGYSLVHAAASYNHLDLLRTLVCELNVPVDLKDEDGETALFVVETVDAAKVLVEELGLDPNVTNDEGLTAREKLEAEGEFPAVVQYLAGEVRPGNVTAATADAQAVELPPAPEGIQVTIGTMAEQEATDGEVDPEFRRRIEELAAMENFDAPEGQAQLRQLVQDVLAGQGLSEERGVRPRQA
ncbi:hypothetical protein VTK73DRAFT_6861 [Phialemonium thermophilum]|uniref:Ankyrin repeat-containing protein n=1 Tax=Phialemonium thermophilum TaxID=223376 RepID=A0ABR3XVD8_9PEZI